MIRRSSSQIFHEPPRADTQGRRAEATDQSSAADAAEQQKIDEEICRYFGLSQWGYPADTRTGTGAIWIGVVFAIFSGAFWLFCYARMNQGSFWTAILLVLGPWLFPILLLWQRRPHRRYRWFLTGHCPNCGYDVRASPGRCPECGLFPEKPKHLPLMRWWSELGQKKED